MENQYNYYTSDQETYSQNSQNMNYEGSGEEKTPGGPEKKTKNRKTPKWVQAACLGLVFGLVASAAFQTSNIIADKITGKETTSDAGNKQAKTTTTANSTKLTTSSGTTVTTDIAQIVENTMPSVVSITSMSVQEVQSFFGGVQEQESESAGSGIIIGQNDEELLIVTNNHVVEGSDTLTVSFIDEESVEANIKGTDSDKDLAVVAVPLENIKDSTMDEIAVATLGDSTALQVGEPAIAIGNALGYGQSVTTGIISATNRSIDSYDGELIQTDAAINPGNSGGALLNANGEVIGINCAKIAQEQVEGIGYAIPISDASDIITDLMNQKTKTKVLEEERGYIGVKGVDVTEDSAQMYNMPTGVYISEVLSGTGAEKAGLTKGSVITAINGTTVDGQEALQEQLQYYRIGETVTLTVQIPGNNGEYDEKDVEVTLGEAQK